MGRSNRVWANDRQPGDTGMSFSVKFARPVLDGATLEYEMPFSASVGASVWEFLGERILVSEQTRYR